LVSGDLIVATRTLRRPRLPFLSCLDDIDLDTALSRSLRANHPLRTLGRGFSVLDNFGSPLTALDLQIALHRLSLYTLAVDDYLAARSSAQSLAMLGEERTFVMYGLMQLAPDLDQPCAPGDELLELCYLAIAIYSLLCIFPIADAPFGRLVQRIKSLLLARDFTKEWSEAPKLMLWMSFMTCIASVGQEDGTRTWLVSIIDRCLRRLKIDSFNSLKDSVLLEFLWLPTTNDDDGNDLWDEIEASNPFQGG
jgi:hypothetical protein